MSLAGRPAMNRATDGTSEQNVVDRVGDEVVTSADALPLLTDEHHRSCGAGLLGQPLNGGKGGCWSRWLEGVAVGGGGYGDLSVEVSS